MIENREILHEYCGNQFCLEEQNSWYSKRTSYAIKGIFMKNSRLHLPDSCQGNPVTRWYMREKEPLILAKTLYLPASITEISIENALFPALEAVEVPGSHPRFFTDGKMLFSADGRELLYSLAAGNQEKAVVPKDVRKISRNAFQGTKCSEIVFENPDVSVERDAFADSQWMKRQGDSCMVGNLFFRLNRSVEHLRVPDGIRRFHESAFMKAVPDQLDTPVPPSGSIIKDLGDRQSFKQCSELIMRSESAKLDFKQLRRWYGLQAIQVPESHKKYRTVDGVVFSKDGKTLEFYPQGKMQKSYIVPEGVVKVGKSAFQEQRFLKEVTLPDTVTKLGMSAFFRCNALEKVTFSANLREIPDASAYQNGGVFEGCGALKEVTLPRKLQYLGSYAFHASGLGQAELNEGLRQIGEYALAAKGLKRIVLPASLERLGKGALLYTHTIKAWAGSAKGLVAAVNAVPPNYTDKCANLEWNRCMITVCHRRSGRTEAFLIPGSLKRNTAYHLDMAWNGDEIDYEEYDACFDAIQDPYERMEFAEQGILRMEEEDSPYTAYMRHSALKIASHLVEEGREQEFLAFLQRGYLSENALSKLLKLTNQKQLTTCSAYILKYQNGQGRKGKRRFVL